VKSGLRRTGRERLGQGCTTASSTVGHPSNPQSHPLVRTAVARLAGLLRTPATGRAWIVPKKYIEKVGRMDYGGSRWGSGPYDLGSMNPPPRGGAGAGSNEQYWRKKLHQARVIKGVPDAHDSMAMRKTGEGGFRVT